MAERASRYLYDWTNVILPLSTRLQTEYAPAIPDPDRFPNIRFADPIRLSVTMTRLVRQNAHQTVASMFVLKQEVDRLCSQGVVLERPCISTDHPKDLSITLDVTGSNGFRSEGGRVRNRLLKVVGRGRFQAMGDQAGLRCVFAIASRDLVPLSEMERALDELRSSLAGSFPWTFTPDRVQLFSRDHTTGEIKIVSTATAPVIAQPAAA